LAQSVHPASIGSAPKMYLFSQAETAEPQRPRRPRRPQRKISSRSLRSSRFKFQLNGSHLRPFYKWLNSYPKIDKFKDSSQKDAESEKNAEQKANSAPLWKKFIHRFVWMS
jgi:hypothetical protein